MIGENGIVVVLEADGFSMAAFTPRAGNVMKTGSTGYDPWLPTRASASTYREAQRMA